MKNKADESIDYILSGIIPAYIAMAIYFGPLWLLLRNFADTDAAIIEQETWFLIAFTLGLTFSIYAVVKVYKFVKVVPYKPNLKNWIKIALVAPWVNEQGKSR